MAHTGIFGRTESGKSFFAQAWARSLILRGEPVQIIDPVGSFSDPIFEPFLRESIADLEFSSTGCDVFVDEAGDFFSLSDRDNYWVARRGRHEGWRLRLIAQSLKSLAPTVRNQLTDYFVFVNTFEATEQLSKLLDFDAEKVLDFQQGDFLHIYQDVVTKKRVCKKHLRGSVK